MLTYSPYPVLARRKLARSTPLELSLSEEGEISQCSGIDYDATPTQASFELETLEFPVPPRIHITDEDDCAEKSSWFEDDDDDCVQRPQSRHLSTLKRGRIRRMRQRIMEAEMRREENEGVRFTKAQRDLLKRTFTSVKAEFDFRELDGMRRLPRRTGYLQVRA